MKIPASINRFIYCILLPMLCAIAFYGRAGQPEQNKATDAGKDMFYHIIHKVYEPNTDTGLQKYVTTITNKIVLAGRISSGYIDTVIFNTPEIFAVTNYHYIFISTGLIALLNSESELAAILSHEMAHIESDHNTKRDEAIEQLVKFHKENSGSAYHEQADDLSRTYILLELQRTRRQFEEEADRKAINYLLSGNYDPYAYLSALRKLEMTVDESMQKRGMESQLISELLSTHPPIHTRINTIQRLLDEYRTNNLKFRDDKDPFRHAVDGMTVFSEVKDNTKWRYQLKYTRPGKQASTVIDEELKEYILLINQVQTHSELENMAIFKQIVLQKK